MSRLLPLSGRARRIGDGLRTDQILAPRDGRERRDAAHPAARLPRDVEPMPAGSLDAGDVLVAGRHFGIGPGAEPRVQALLDAGVRAVVARSFGSGFLRSALNGGLLALTAATDDIAEGDPITLADDGESESLSLRTPRQLIHCDPLAPFARALIEAGGLVPYLRAHGSFGPALPGERF